MEGGCVASARPGWRWPSACSWRCREEGLPAFVLQTPARAHAALALSLAIARTSVTIWCPALGTGDARGKLARACVTCPEMDGVISRAGTGGDVGISVSSAWNVTFLSADVVLDAILCIGGCGGVIFRQTALNHRLL